MPDLSNGIVAAPKIVITPCGIKTYKCGGWGGGLGPSAQVPVNTRVNVPDIGAKIPKKNSDPSPTRRRSLRHRLPAGGCNGLLRLQNEDCRPARRQAGAYAALTATDFRCGIIEPCIVKGTAGKSCHSERSEESRLSRGFTARFFGP